MLIVLFVASGNIDPSPYEGMTLTEFRCARPDVRIVDRADTVDEYCGKRIDEVIEITLPDADGQLRRCQLHVQHTLRFFDEHVFDMAHQCSSYGTWPHPTLGVISRYVEKGADRGPAITDNPDDYCGFIRAVR